MNKVIRTAVVGLGPRGLSFLPLYSKSGHDGFDLAAVCDMNPERFMNIRERWGENVACYTDVHEMVKDPSIDAVIVATNDPDHVEPAVAALKEGKHVLVEKPLCQSVSDAKRITDEAAAAKGVFMMGFELRACVVFQTMKRLLDEGRIGEIKLGHCFDNVSVGGNYFFHNPKRQKAFYKSLLLQKATHSLDLLNWFMGSDPRKVYAVGGRDFYGGTEDPEKRCRECERASSCPYRINPERFVMDYGAAVQIPDYCVWSREMDLNDNSELCITYANGAKATFHECHFTPEYTREFWFVGTKGKLYGYYDNPGRFLVRVQHAYDNDWRSEEWRPMATDGGHGGGDVRLRDEFYERCAKGEKAPDMVSSAYYSTVLAICAEESIDSGMPVAIPEI